MPRDYEKVSIDISVSEPRLALLRAFVDAVWDHLCDTGISWVGFYVPDDTGEQLVLTACRDKPACSPIGMHGACGATFHSGTPLVVRDVAELGDNYVACDPRDRSEVVIPCFERGRCWGVLDLDSHEVDAFDESDVRGLSNLLVRFGLTDAPSGSDSPAQNR